MPAPGFFIGGLARQVGARVAWFPSPASARFRPSWATAKAAVTPRTRILYVNTPVNPTGYVYDETDADAADLAARAAGCSSATSRCRYLYAGRQHLSPGGWAPGTARRPRGLVFQGLCDAWDARWLRGPAAGVARPGVGAARVVAAGGEPTGPGCGVAALTGPGERLTPMAADAAKRGSRAARALAATGGLSCVPPGRGPEPLPLLRRRRGGPGQGI